MHVLFQKPRTKHALKIYMHVKGNENLYKGLYFQGPTVRMITGASTEMLNNNSLL